MAKALIHIGTHKTATSSIQDAFWMNRMSLEHFGVVYPQAGIVTGHHSLAANWITLPEEFRLPDGLKNWRSVIRQLASRDITLFISSEELSRAEPETVIMSELADLFKPFDEVQVVATLRKQPDFIESYFGELVKNSNSPIDLERYMANAEERHLAEGLFLDYNQLYDHILSGFGPESVKFISFENAKRHKTGVIGAYLDLLGNHFPPTLTQQITAVRSNPSAQALHLWLAAKASKNLPIDNHALAAVKAALAEEFGESAKTTLLTRGEHTQICKTFEPLNAMLEKRVKPFQKDFKLEPLGRDQFDVYRNDISNQTLERIAEAAGVQ